VSTARFSFAGELAAFLARERRGHPFQYTCARAATLKNAIEALGVPHTEVGAVTVNGEPATLQRIVREGDTVEVRGSDPFSAEKGSDPFRFLADAHLGGLARFLRMLGFDTVHRNAFEDAEIRRLASEELRIVLTRDRELLKCREIRRGCYVRALRPEAQLQEVAARYGLAPLAQPFTLCLHCNVPLAVVDKAEVAHRLAPAVLAVQENFSYCAGCDRVYWPGSHYRRMRERLRQLGTQP
jgi:uncharacterized protein with PIN domain/sulfur carrier protein ThiS